jgi:excisionase family DNA binding protein
VDPLKEWYRYVDRQSRPVRRLAGNEEEAPASAPWRPWKDAAEQENGAEDGLRPEEIPELTPFLGAPTWSEAQQAAPLEYEDLTVDDQLQPMLQFSVPELSPPVFEVELPRLQVSGEPEPQVPEMPTFTSPSSTQRDEEPSEPPLLKTEAAPSGQPVLTLAGPESVGTRVGAEATDGDQPAGELPPASDLVSRRLELLSQVRTTTQDEDAGKTRSRESRVELVQRLVDPTLTLEETALLLGVCPTTVRRYTNKGILPHFRTQGNQRRFRFSDVIEFLEKQQRGMHPDTDAGAVEIEEMRRSA